MILPRGWENATIGDVADTVLGKMLDAAKNKGEMVPYLRNINVRWGGFDLSDLEEMRVTSDELGALSVRDGDLFVCEGGEPGRSAIWRGGNQRVIFQKALHRLRAMPGVEPEFIAKHIAFSAATGAFSDLLTGTTIRHLTQVAIKRVELPLPPTAEQRRIVAKLDALTARIARARAELDRVPVLAASLRQTSLRDAFAWNAETLPDGWEWKRIDEIGAVQLGRQRSPKDHQGPHMRPYMRAANITWSGWDLSDVKEMNFSPDEFEVFSLRDGDVLLNEGSGSAKEVGKPAVWRGEVEGACFQNTLLRVRPDGYLPDLLRYALLYTALSGQFIANTKGVNIIHIGKGGLSKSKVPVPPIDQQTALLQQIDRAFVRADRLETEAARARKLFDRLEAAILAKAFRGELVPQDPNDEPASVLLERIRAERASAPKGKRTRRSASS